ncbi:hypothetical protein DACRYDRAFT_25266 [Dacryopinax primogenitus]|uniref:Uncharacterized protein n=1 Tax=Dacryopinax primogenitus (strain DJM 731) TaxID=1858805 RepID=M5FV25_DACPD|nr:uncharacterized protein DACRYDRAFT_25266 [Dacryopinax primogenitus]EJT97146.1 hypothetical protein DACRYDRAFT_25266 [Dacryopinax primogenitus]
MDNSTNLNCGSVNTDVSGVAVRVSLYASVTIGLIMMRWFTHDMDAFQDAARTSFITSIALVISSLVSLYGGAGLALVDALVVTTVTSLVMAYAFIVGSQGTAYARHIGANKFEMTYTLALAAVLHTILWMAFGIVVWRDPSNFGNGAIEGCFPNPNLNVVFWVVGLTLSPTNASLRAFAISEFAIGGGLGILSTIASFIFTKLSKTQFEAVEYDVGRMRQTGPMTHHGPLPHLRPNGSQENPPIIADQLEGGPQAVLADGVAGPRVDQERRAARPANRLIVWLNTPTVKKIGLWWKPIAGIGGIIGYLYLIVTTESLITVNNQRATTNSLTFGQILSLVLLLDQIIFQPMTQIFNHLLERAVQKQKEIRRQSNANRGTGPYELSPITATPSPAGEDALAK